MVGVLLTLAHSSAGGDSGVGGAFERCVRGADCLAEPSARCGAAGSTSDGSGTVFYLLLPWRHGGRRGSGSVLGSGKMAGMRGVIFRCRLLVWQSRWRDGGHRSRYPRQMSHYEDGATIHEPRGRKCSSIGRMADPKFSAGSCAGCSSAFPSSELKQQTTQRRKFLPESQTDPAAPAAAPGTTIDNPNAAEMTAWKPRVNPWLIASDRGAGGVHGGAGHLDCQRRAAAHCRQRWAPARTKAPGC